MPDRNPAVKDHNIFCIIMFMYFVCIFKHSIPKAQLYRVFMFRHFEVSLMPFKCLANLAFKELPTYFRLVVSFVKWKNVVLNYWIPYCLSLKEE
jgi:hypothetical protein